MNQQPQCDLKGREYDDIEDKEHMKRFFRRNGAQGLIYAVADVLHKEAVAKLNDCSPETYRGEYYEKLRKKLINVASSADQIMEDLIERQRQIDEHNRKQTEALRERRRKEKEQTQP